MEEPLKVEKPLKVGSKKLQRNKHPLMKWE